jgi:hypothetical protein
LLGYSYDTTIGFWGTALTGAKLLSGEVSAEPLFRCLAHRRVPSLDFHQVPRENWNDKAVATIKEYFALYKAARIGMQKRTVLPDDAGVLWEAPDGRRLLWSFQSQDWSDGRAVDLLTGANAPGNRLNAWRVYKLQ